MDPGWSPLFLDPEDLKNVVAGPDAPENEPDGPDQLGGREPDEIPDLPVPSGPARSSPSPEPSRPARSSPSPGPSHPARPPDSAYRYQPSCSAPPIAPPRPIDQGSSDCLDKCKTLKLKTLRQILAAFNIPYTYDQSLPAKGSLCDTRDGKTPGYSQRCKPVWVKKPIDRICSELCSGQFRSERRYKPIQRAGAVLQAIEDRYADRMGERLAALE